MENQGVQIIFGYTVYIIMFDFVVNYLHVIGIYVWG